MRKRKQFLFQWRTIAGEGLSILVVLLPSQGMETAWHTPPSCPSPAWGRHPSQSLDFSLLSTDSASEPPTASRHCRSCREPSSPSMMGLGGSVPSPSSSASHCLAEEASAVQCPKGHLFQLVFALIIPE